MVLSRGGRISGGLILGVLTSKMRSFLLVDNTFGWYPLWGLDYHLIVEVCQNHSQLCQLCLYGDFGKVGRGLAIFPRMVCIKPPIGVISKACYPKMAFGSFNFQNGGTRDAYLYGQLDGYRLGGLAKRHTAGGGARKIQNPTPPGGSDRPPPNRRPLPTQTGVNAKAPKAQRLAKV